MVKKADVKVVGIVMLAIFATGLAMYQFRDIEIVDSARRGYGG